MSDERKDKNYVESEMEDYYTTKKDSMKYTRKVKVKGNNEDYVSKVGRTLITDDPTS